MHACEGVIKSFKSVNVCIVWFSNGKDQYTFEMVDCAETKIQRTRAPENAIRDGGDESREP